MLDEKEIIRISKDSRNDKISFLEAVKTMKTRGVEGYRVDVVTHSTIYFTETNSFSEKENGNINVVKKFDKNLILEALKARQSGKISYEQFMEKIGIAGVFDYIVDLQGKKVIYRGLFEQHIEKLPL